MGGLFGGFFQTFINAIISIINTIFGGAGGLMNPLFGFLVQIFTIFSA